MTTLLSKPKFARAYVPTTALARTAECTGDALHVLLTDGRALSVPLAWFPRLLSATPEQRERVEIGTGGLSLHWPDVDEDLSVPNLLAGGDTRSA